MSSVNNARLAAEARARAATAFAKGGAPKVNIDNFFQNAGRTNPQDYYSPVINRNQTPSSASRFTVRTIS